MSIGKIEHLPLRDVWEHEARDFSTWLAENIDVVNNATGLALTSVEREQPAGSFNVDLIAEQSTGGTVVIENQLERSDHDHLGKVITYLTAYDATAAVWIVSEARPEHTAAINWLNNCSEVDFYLLQANAIRIGESLPALLLTRIVGPSAEIEAIRKDKQDISDRELLRREFWSGLLESAATRTPLHSSVGAGKAPWLSASSGHRGISFVYGAKQHSCSVFLYIDRGQGKDTENEAIYDYFYKRKPDIESAIGSKLVWSPLEEKRACTISTQDLDIGYRSSPEEWPKAYKQMIDFMIQFETTYKPMISRAVEHAASVIPTEPVTDEN